MTSTNGKPPVVLVEDNREMADVVKLNLEIEGFKVTVFDNAPQALEHLKEVGGHVILLSDHMLKPGPDGTKMTGLELIREARKLGTNVRSILYSAASTTVKAEADKEHIAFVGKPMGINDLVNAVNAAHARMQAAEPPHAAIVDNGPVPLTGRAERDQHRGLS